MNGDCLGCQLVKNEIPVNIVYEDDHVCALLDIEPFNEGHILILPKKHYLDLDELEPETAHAIMEASILISKVIKKVYNPDGITVCQNGGKFNDLTHYHMHLIPRYEGDGFTWSEPLYKHGASTRLAETKEKLIAAFQELKESRAFR